MARKKQEEETAGGCPEWLATYGDLVTLLLVFFVLLFAMSSVDAQKFQSLANSLEGALGVSPGGTNTSVNESVGGGLTQLPDYNAVEKEQNPNKTIENDITTSELEQLYKEINKMIEEKGLKPSTDTSYSGTFIEIRFNDHVLFDIGKADIKSQAIPVLNEMGKILINKNVNIRIEGHTDNKPIHTHQFPSNWELSSSRALNILHFFQTKTKFNPEKLSAVGRGEYRPIASNDTAEGRAKNRRVEIIIESEGVDEALLQSLN